MSTGKQRLDELLYKTDYTPAIIVGPAHPIEQFEGYGIPEPGYYRGVIVRRHAGYGEDLYVVPLDQAFDD